MLYIYTCYNDKLAPAETLPPVQDGDSVIWFDLFNPTPQEDRLVEQRLGISIPTRDEMEEIELSSRLYHEDSAEFMTMTAVTNFDTDERVKTPITFHSQRLQSCYSPLHGAEALLNIHRACSAAQGGCLCDRRADYGWSDRVEHRLDRRWARKYRE
jgi:Mg2+ and Co2+ transporter CorA